LVGFTTTTESPERRVTLGAGSSQTLVSFVLACIAHGAIADKSGSNATIEVTLSGIGANGVLCQLLSLR
jgi:hypothetical protein